MFGFESFSNNYHFNSLNQMLFHFLIFGLFTCANAIVGGWETRKNRLFMTYFFTGRENYDRNSDAKRILALTGLF